MRFTSKFKKKFNGQPKLLNQNNKLDRTQRHDSDNCAENTLPRKKYVGCKYCKLVPRTIGDRVFDQFNLADIYDSNTTDAKESRFKHFQIIGRFIISSAFCMNSMNKKYILHLKKKVKTETKSWKPDISDLDTMYMLKISEEFQKIVKKTIHRSDNSCRLKKNKGLLSDHCQRLYGSDGTYEITLRDTIADGPKGERHTPMKAIGGNSNSKQNCHFNKARASQDHAVCRRKEPSSYGNCKEIHKSLTFDCLSDKYEGNSGILPQEIAHKQTHGMIEIGYPRRFGDINAKHCNAISNLMNQRLSGKNYCSPPEVCIFFQQSKRDSGGLTNLRLDFAYKCLSTYFFPGQNIVTVSVQRDLQQFLYKTVFKHTSFVRDLFGVRFYVQDDLKIRAVLMVSKSISALLRHQDVCLLDTLSLILGIDRDTLLILGH